MTQPADKPERTPTPQTDRFRERDSSARNEAESLEVLRDLLDSHEGLEEALHTVLTTPDEMPNPIWMARVFHEAYERLAPQYGYETRAETREFSHDSPNGRLMTAVCEEFRKAMGAAPLPECGANTAETPRTDAAVRMGGRMGGITIQTDRERHYIEHARQLERELVVCNRSADACLREIDSLRAQRDSALSGCGPTVCPKTGETCTCKQPCVAVSATGPDFQILFDMIDSRLPGNDRAKIRNLCNAIIALSATGTNQEKP